MFENCLSGKSEENGSLTEGKRKNPTRQEE